MLKDCLLTLYNKIVNFFSGEGSMKRRNGIRNTRNLPSTEEKVFIALENPKFKWRTLHGVARDTKLDLPKIETAINYLKENNLIVVASNPTPNGDLLFTSLNRYKHNKEFRVNRWLSVLSDEIK